MPILITYDIENTTNSIHTEVKNAMIQKGYDNHIPIQKGGKTKLPNTCLVNASVTAETAAADLTAVCKSLDANLEKYIALNVSYENGMVKSND